MAALTREITALKAAAVNVKPGAATGIVIHERVKRGELLYLLKDLEKEALKNKAMVAISLELQLGNIEVVWKVSQEEAPRMTLSVIQVACTAVKDGYTRNTAVQQKVQTKLAQSARVESIPLREDAVDTRRYLKGARPSAVGLSGVPLVDLFLM